MSRTRGTPRRLESVQLDTEQDLELWSVWVRRGNGSGLGYPRTAAGFADYLPRYPREPSEPLNVHRAESVDSAVRALPLLERRVLAYLFVEGAPSWAKLANLVCRDPELPAVTRHTAREIAERGAARVETWLERAAA